MLFTRIKILNPLKKITDILKFKGADILGGILLQLYNIGKKAFRPQKSVVSGFQTNP